MLMNKEETRERVFLFPGTGEELRLHPLHLQREREHSWPAE